MSKLDFTTASIIQGLMSPPRPHARTPRRTAPRETIRARPSCKDNGRPEPVLVISAWTMESGQLRHPAGAMLAAREHGVPRTAGRQERPGGWRASSRSMLPLRGSMAPGSVLGMKERRCPLALASPRIRLRWPRLVGKSRLTSLNRQQGDAGRAVLGSLGGRAGGGSAPRCRAPDRPPGTPARTRGWCFQNSLPELDLNAASGVLPRLRGRAGSGTMRLFVTRPLTGDRTGVFAPSGGGAAFEVCRGIDPS